MCIYKLYKRYYVIEIDIPSLDEKFYDKNQIRFKLCTIRPWLEWLFIKVHKLNSYKLESKNLNYYSLGFKN